MPERHFEGSGKDLESRLERLGFRWPVPDESIRLELLPLGWPPLVHCKFGMLVWARSQLAWTLSHLAWPRDRLFQCESAGSHLRNLY